MFYVFCLGLVICVVVVGSIAISAYRHTHFKASFNIYLSGRDRGKEQK